MVVTISKVDGFRESLLAQGLVMFLAGEGINADIAGSADVKSSPEQPPTPALLVAAGEAATPPAAPAKKNKPGRKPAGLKVAAAKVDDTSGSAPRVTNASRIADYLQERGKALSAVQIAAAVKLETAQVSNVLWNMEKAGRVTKDEGANPMLWSLVCQK